MNGEAEHVLKEWAVQILVLLSFSLQLFLFISATFRRRSASKVLSALLWLAYLAADSTATYTIGHLSISSISQVHGLVPFWAPFLLLHLGGQDTITAYAIEDSRLWLRHLQTLVVQSLGTAYVIYKYISWTGSSKLVVASVLMLVVGFAKYGERVRALRCGNSDMMIKITQSSAEEHEHLILFRDKVASYTKDEFLESLVNRHIMLGLFVNLFHHRKVRRPSWCHGDTSDEGENVRIWELIDHELSLIYDIMYTKDWVIHTWSGLWIRVSSLAAIIYSFLLFHLVINKDVYARVDIAITYVLLVGAALLEIISGLRSIWSIWAVRFMSIYKFSCLFFMVHILSHLVVQKLMDACRRICCCLERHLDKGERRIIGQFNMLKYCSWFFQPYYELKYRYDSHESIIIQHLPPPVEISVSLENLLMERICAVAKMHNGAEDLMNRLGQNKDLLTFDMADFNIKIITWYIATEAILCSLDNSSRSDTYVEPIKSLSDYMMFLLVKYPEMTPGFNHNIVVSEAITWFKRNARFRSREQLGKKLLDNLDHPTKDIIDKLLIHPEEKTPCNTGIKVAVELCKREDKHQVLKAIFDLWVEILCQAGSQCSSDSHARKLSSGAEFLTIVWLLSRYLAMLAQPVVVEDETSPPC